MYGGYHAWYSDLQSGNVSRQIHSAEVVKLVTDAAYGKPKLAQTTKAAQDDQQKIRRKKQLRTLGCIAAVGITAAATMLYFGRKAK